MKEKFVILLVLQDVYIGKTSNETPCIRGKILR